MRVTDWEERQAAHYDEIAASYEVHYSDEWSRRYRRTFINERLTKGVKLAGARVLDAMCGSGQMAEYLSSRGALVTGLDVSSEVINLFKRKLPQCGAVARSIFTSGFPDEHFDAVMVVGGLHHVHPDVGGAVAEIHRIVKPGGHFYFAEPHVGSLADMARQLWYRLDPLFDANEAGIDLADLQRQNADRFDFVRTTYTGGLPTCSFITRWCSATLRAPSRSSRRRCCASSGLLSSCKAGVARAWWSANGARRRTSNGAPPRP
jgi:ubiquinone/menaquinone biosynthesis C-methylase UbiE